MKNNLTNCLHRLPVILLTGLLFLIAATGFSQQLGAYNFTGTGTCPNQNPAVTAQPANAVFSVFSDVGGTCEIADDVYRTKELNKTGNINPAEYFTFTVTAQSGNVLNLTSLSFTHFAQDDENNNIWHLRSSLNNYTSDISSAPIMGTPLTPVITLPATFSGINAVTFRIYVEKMKDHKAWILDDVVLNGTVGQIPPNPADPVSNSPQCANPGATLNITGTPDAGISWYWQTSATGTSTADNSASRTVTTSGTYYLRARNDATLSWSNGAGSVTVVITPDVANPVFGLGATSTRCQGAGTVNYTATAANNTGLTYSLDAASIAGGNTINSSTGAVSYDAAWSGISVITVSADGCAGPKNATHTVTTGLTVATPVFAAGAASNRCIASGNITYGATATNSTSITYSLDAASLTGGNTINATTGAVNWFILWFGTTTITATANGCGGPKTATHVVSISGSVSTPSFTSGTTSTRCQGAGSITYTATANNASAITYSIDGASSAGGNTINPSTGEVTFDAAWSGNAVITASAAGCNGPKTSTHTVSVTASVGTPVFTAGATSSRCQAAGPVTYTTTVTNSTSKTYSLDAASIAGSVTINTSTGAVTYPAAWNGTSVITVTAAGCNGPSTASHTVTTTPVVGTVSFTGGTVSTRCQGAGTVSYDAAAINTTGITYSINAAALTAGNTINATTGDVTFTAAWTGSTIITATAGGCTPKTATHTVTITATVGTPVFTMGATSSRCQGAGTANYIATATGNTGITYTLDAASTAAGNTINAATGSVTYVASWTGTTIVTATATGCNGPKSANHTVTVNITVSGTTFTGGATSIRCQGAGSVPYPATASNATSIVYSIDAASTSGGNTINSVSGAVAYAAGWSGTTTVTATANGCNGPVTATHIVSVTPTVGTPVFTGGATSTRCQGANTVTYTATSTNSTAITYSLDAASIAGGNTINATSGAVTFTAAWNSNAVITATATGCNGPKSSSHTVTNNTTVSAPIFAMGAQSVRTQGAATVTYTATAANSTSITYSLDAASLTGGNTINATTGAVSWNTSWFGASVITASAAGCNGPATSTHIVNINSVIVQSPLYLSTGQTLDRIDPVSTNITTTLLTADLSSTATTNVTFSLNPALCNNLTIKAQNISVTLYLGITSGTMPVNPNITANIASAGTTIINLTNPVYNSATGIISWTGTLGADVTLPANNIIDLKITTAQPSVVFKINYHSASKPSRISLFPVSTFVDFISFNVYNAAYPGGTVRTNGNPNQAYYVRSVVTTPFGYKDLTGLDLRMNPPGTTFPVTCVDSSTCTRTYEYPWTPTGATATYYMLATAKEGYENIIKNSELLTFNVCSVCAPGAVNDSATGAGGAPLIVDVLANDYDANNNIKPSSLSIAIQPDNGNGYVSNNKIVYLPNGTFAGKDTLTYEICDSTGLCSQAQVFFTINPLLIDPCAEATKTHTYIIPYPEKDAYVALLASSNTTMPSNNIRTILSLTMPYPNMTIVWDEWEDGYEINALNPLQNTTKVWGDGNPYNGIAPGYDDDIIPAGGSIVLDNTMPANPRVSTNIFYDGKDKITSSGQVAITQVCGEPTRMPVQAIKTNVTSTADFGQSFTIPLGQNFPSRDFQYTALFVRAEEDGTVVEIDKDNNGTLETTFTLNQGQSYLVNGGVLYGATVTSNKPIGVELNAGGVDQYSIRNAPIYPATWYSHTYYTPVPTSDNAGDTQKDTSAVMFYNSLNRPITINWSSGAPANGTITIPAKTCVRYPLAYSLTNTYKFYNPTGESFTAIEIVDSYTPNSTAQDGTTYDWSFNLISEARLTDFATTAWAPGGLDLIAPTGPDVNGNPIWVTPNMNTTIYVKWDGNVSGTSGSISPCGLRYDVSYSLNALKYIKLRDPNDNDQSGLAVYTCNGAKIAAVYGEDPQGSTTGIGIAYWDVGTTILPFCKQKLIFANDDYARTLTNQPVTIPVLVNDFGYLATVDPTSVTNTALLQAKHGSIVINTNGTIVYTPALNYVGKDTLEYNVCSTPTPIVCDIATVYIDISACPAPSNGNLITGNVFIDTNEDGINNDGNAGLAGAKVYLYLDGNCNLTGETNELKDSVTVDATGAYQFISYPEKFVLDDFDGPNGTRTCATGSDGNTAWTTSWSDLGDPSGGFCVTPAQSVVNTDAEICKDGNFSYALRLKDNNVSATRVINLTGSSYAFLSFSYRRKSATLTAGKDIIVQASKNGTAFSPIYTIKGDGTTDANYVDIVNQDISAYIAGTTTTYIRFLTNNLVADGDTVYIDNVKIQYLNYPTCYIAKLNAGSVPSTYHTTTALFKTFQALSSQTCLSPYDFGVAKNKISITGTLFNDANGMTDNLINGAAMGNVSGAPMYAYLKDSTGKVAQRATLNSTTGAFTFPAADVNTNYTLSVSATSVNLGDAPPANNGLAAMSSAWVGTGDAYGTNNTAGSGFKPSPNSSVTVKTATTNITGVDFAVERVPDSYDRVINYGINTPGLKYAVTGGLTGMDAEDGALANGKTYKITSLPAGAKLYYNNILVTVNQVISNFTAAMLQIDPDDPTYETSFKYASQDAALLFDPVPNTIIIRWVSVVPVTLVNFTGVLNGTKTNLAWVTDNELNTDFFDVERSANSSPYAKIGTVNASGTGGQHNYSLVDPSPVKGTNYYRLKIMDNEGSFSYSNIVAVRIDEASGNNMNLSVRPNPFSTKIDVSFTLDHNTKLSMILYDMNGKRIATKEEKGLKGQNRFTFLDLEDLPSGTYILQIITDNSKTEQKIMKF